VPQLLALVDKALDLKAQGNKAFTSKPPRLDLARDDYLRALDCLPPVSKHLPLPSNDEERIREVSDEEAEQIELDFLAGPARIRADNAIRDAQKALWGNLGAVYSKQPTKDKETVDACTQALKFDPKYEKALLRRAAANERIGTWTSLVAAQRGK
jgi:tetratricopeptide (TPR) repeat protein